MIARLSVSHGLILLGALGMFFGNANPVLHLPLAALLYPACLGLLAREDFPFRRGWLCGLIGSAAALYAGYANGCRKTRSTAMSKYFWGRAS